MFFATLLTYSVAEAAAVDTKVSPRLYVDVFALSRRQADDSGAK